MFIIVKYGQNESLLCNPNCATVNLMKSIKRRAGFGNTNLTLDLSDETGLIKELDGHKNEYATSLLSSHATYILLQKNPIQTDDHTNAQFTYTALLEHIEDLFPGFNLHVAEMESKTLKSRRMGSKQPSPAGRFLSKPTKKSQKVLSARKK